MRRGLLSAGYVRSNRHGDSTLLRRLADRQAWHLVLLAFRHVGDLSEIDAVSVLRRLCDKQLSNTNNTDMDYDSTDNAPIRVDELLAAFMATPTNSSLLVRAFHRLSTAHTLLVLGIIVQWMRHWSEAVANDKPTAALLSSSLPPPRLDAAFLPTPYLPLNGRTAPSQTLVIDTAALLLDAHLARLILTPEARPLLRELQQLVKAELELQRSCEILRGMLGGYWLRSLMPSAKEFSTHGLGKEATSAEAARIKGQLAAQSRKPARHGRKQAQKMARSARAGIYGLEVLQFEV
ncbi:hypothetical protein BDF19DRAFT_1824 [Syncephalis fuscata]|nr:hypothetical protein BDF19DRAFT_1824 [Syncephalis fuscata]